MPSGWRSALGGASGSEPAAVERTMQFPGLAGNVAFRALSGDLSFLIFTEFADSPSSGDPVPSWRDTLDRLPDRGGKNFRAAGAGRADS